MIDCLSFELSVDTSDALSVLIYERHSRQGHFKDRHDILKALDLDKEKAGVIGAKLQGAKRRAWNVVFVVVNETPRGARRNDE